MHDTDVSLGAVDVIERLRDKILQSHLVVGRVRVGAQAIRELADSRKNTLCRGLVDLKAVANKDKGISGVSRRNKSAGAANDTKFNAVESYCFARNISSRDRRRGIARRHGINLVIGRGCESDRVATGEASLESSLVHHAPCRNGGRTGIAGARRSLQPHRRYGHENGGAAVVHGDLRTGTDLQHALAIVATVGVVITHAHEGLLLALVTAKSIFARWTARVGQPTQLVKPGSQLGGDGLAL